MVTGLATGVIKCDSHLCALFLSCYFVSRTIFSLLIFDIFDVIKEGLFHIAAVAFRNLMILVTYVLLCILTRECLK